MEKNGLQQVWQKCERFENNEGKIHEKWFNIQSIYQRQIINCPIIKWLLEGKIRGVVDS